MHRAIMEFPDQFTGQFRHGGQEMSRFLRKRPSGETGHRTRRFHHAASEPLEDRALMSSSLLSFLIQSPPAAAPALSPVVVSSQLPKNVSGRIAGLYELSKRSSSPVRSCSPSMFPRRAFTPSWSTAAVPAQLAPSRGGLGSRSTRWFRSPLAQEEPSVRFPC